VRDERPAAELLTEPKFLRLTGAPLRLARIFIESKDRGLRLKMTRKSAPEILVLIAILCFSASVLAQGTGAQTQKAMGTIKSISGNTVTLTPDNGSDVKVLVQDSAKVLRAVPGASLKDATPISVQDLRPGDRILVHGAAGDNQSIDARLVVAMTRADIAQKHQEDLQQWQRNGVGGLVKAVDPSASSITVATTSATGPKEISVKIAKNSIIRRYAPDSVMFNDAKPGTLDQIHPGDQLRARGTRNADGTELAADEIVSGTFRNVAGLIASVDAASNTVTVNDLATKKPVVIRITSGSQMHQLPPLVAQRLAMQLKGGKSPNGPASGERPDARPANTERRPEGAPGPGGPGAPGGPHPGGDFNQILRRMPAVTLASLNKGEAVMVVTTADATVITLLSGVEPILTASPNGSGAASILTPWSLGGGGGEGGGGDIPQ
jgi:hypothetical protein